jgi:F-type H+-transporting ATPase subunit epsilon
MADMMQFDLVSPERMLASFEASEIEIPGAEGDFTAMANHAAVITTLRPGLIKAKGASEVAEYVVTGGFVEVGTKGASVLAENAVPRAEMTRATIDEMVAEAEAAAKDATGADKDAADKRIADIKALGELLGL